jgi:hypothetical protein
MSEAPSGFFGRWQVEPGGVFEVQDANVGVLHHIVVIGQRGKPFREVDAESRLVRLHVL